MTESELVQKITISVGAAGARVIDDIREKLGGLGDHARSIGEKARGGLSSLKDTLTSINPVTIAAGAAMAGFAVVTMKAAGAAMEFVSSGVEANAAFERYNTQLGSLLGSTEAAQERMEELAAFGAATPFELPQLVEAEKVMIGFGLTTGKSMKLAGLSAEEMRTTIGDVAAGTGKDFAEIALTFGKFSAGATGEAIARLQELGVVTKEELAAMGIEFDKGGALISPIPVAFEAATKIANEKFGGGMDALSNTFEGKMSTLSDTWSQIKRIVTAPLFDAAKAGLDVFLPFLGEIASALETFAAGAYYQGFEEIGAAIERFTGLAVGGWFQETGAAVEDLINSLKGAFAEGGIQGVIDKLSELSGFDIAGTFERVKDGAIEIGRAIASIDFAALVDKARTVATVIGRVLTFLATNPAIAAIIAAVTAIGGAFFAVMAIVGPFVPIVMAIVGAIGSAVAAAGGFGVVLGALAAILTGPIAVAVGVAILVFTAWQARGEEIKAFFAQAWEVLKAIFAAGVALIEQKFQSMIDAGVELVQAVEEQFEAIKDALAAMVAAAKAKWDEIKASTLAAWNAVKAGITAAVDAVAAKVNAVLGAVRAVWDSTWNALQSAASTVWQTILATVTTAVDSMVEGVRAYIAFLVDQFRFAFAIIAAVVSAEWATIKATVQVGIEFVRSVIQAGIQLLSGDWKGAWETIKTATGEAIGRVREILGTFLGFLQNMVGMIVGRATEIGSGIISGIKKGVDDAWTAFTGWLTRKMQAIIGSVLATFGIESPSKVFAEIGGWIMAGLALGIGENEADTVDALARVFNGMTQVIESAQKTMKAVFEFEMPASIDVLREAFRALWRDAQILATEAIDVKQWVRGWGGDELELLEPVSGVIGHLSNIVEGMAKVSLALAEWTGAPAAKIAEMQGAVVALVGMAMNVVNLGAVVGLADVAETVKHAAEIASAVAGLDIDKATRLAADKMEIVRLNTLDLLTEMGQVSRYFREVMTDEQRAAMADGFKAFAEVVGAAAAAARAAMFTADDLDGLVALTADHLGVARASILAMLTEIGQVSRYFREVMTGDARAALVEGMGQFADVVGSAVSIMRDVLGIGVPETLADLGAIDWTRLAAIATAAYEAVEAASTAFRAAGNKANAELVEGVKQFTEGAGAALRLLADVMKIEEQDPGLWQTDWLRLASIADAALLGVEQASTAFRAAGAEANGALVEGVKQFTEGAGAALRLVGDVMAFKGGEFDPTKVTVDFYRFAEFAKFALRTVQAVGRSFVEMGEEARGELMRGVRDFTDGAGAAVKLIADVMAFKTGEFDPDKTITDFRRFAEFAKFALLSVREAARSMIAMGADERDAIVAGVKAFADAAGSAIGIVSAVSGITARAGELPDQRVIEALFGWVAEAIATVQRSLGFVSIDAANLAKAGAEAAGAIGGAIESAVGGVMAALGLADTRLFGSDPNAPGLGFMQKARGRRADFFAQQLRDTVGRAVTAMQQALSGITITVDDPKVTAIGQLGEAFGKLADSLKALADAKLPDAARLAAVVAAVTMAQGQIGGAAGGGAGGGGSAGAGGGPVTVTADSATVENVTLGDIVMGDTHVYLDGRVLARAVADAFTADVTIQDELGKALGQRQANRGP